jgi:hypothetical protein
MKGSKHSFMSHFYWLFSNKSVDKTEVSYKTATANATKMNDSLDDICISPSDKVYCKKVCHFKNPVWGQGFAVVLMSPG